MSRLFKFSLLIVVVAPAMLTCMGALIAAPVRETDTMAQVGGGLAAGSAAGFLLGLLPGAILAGGALLVYAAYKWLCRKAGGFRE